MPQERNKGLHPCTLFFEERANFIHILTFIKTDILGLGVVYCQLPHIGILPYLVVLLRSKSPGEIFGKDTTLIFLKYVKFCTYFIAYVMFTF